MKGLPRIEQVHAWIVVDDDGTEGIPAIASPMGPMPMMCGDQPGAVAALDQRALEVAKLLGKPVTHCVFETRHEVEVHQPSSG